MMKQLVSALIVVWFGIWSSLVFILAWVGGSVTLREPNIAVLTIETVVAVSVLGYGVFLVAHLARR